MTRLLAEFEQPEDLLAAIGRTRAKGVPIIDAFAPFPVEGLDQALGLADQKVNWLGFTGMVLGAMTGWFFQWYANTDYTLNIGGRPWLAPPSFTVLTFEFAVLLGGFFMFFGVLILSRLPKLHHPLFEIPQFRRVTSDRYFLMVDAHDDAARRFVEDLHPASIAEVEG